MGNFALQVAVAVLFCLGCCAFFAVVTCCRRHRARPSEAINLWRVGPDVQVARVV